MLRCTLLAWWCDSRRIKSWATAEGALARRFCGEPPSSVSCYLRNLERTAVDHLTHSEAEDLVLQLADGSRLVVSQRLRRLLECRDHRWRAADQDLDILSWRWQAFLRYISCYSSPTRIDNIP